MQGLTKQILGELGLGATGDAQLASAADDLARRSSAPLAPVALPAPSAPRQVTLEDRLHDVEKKLANANALIGWSVAGALGLVIVFLLSKKGR